MGHRQAGDGRQLLTLLRGEEQGSNVRVTSVSGTVMTSLGAPDKNDEGLGVTTVMVHAGQLASQPLIAASHTHPLSDCSIALTQGQSLMSIKGAGPSHW